MSDYTKNFFKRELNITLDAMGQCASVCVMSVCVWNKNGRTGRGERVTDAPRISDYKYVVTTMGEREREPIEGLEHAITGEKPFVSQRKSTSIAENTEDGRVANLHDVWKWHGNQGRLAHSAYATLKPSTSTTKANMANKM